MNFWKNHSTKVFTAIFVLLTALIFIFDIKEAKILHFSFEEKVFLPAIGAIFFALALLIIQKKIIKKSTILKNLNAMNNVSKIFIGLTTLFFLIGIIITIFDGISFIGTNSEIISEERFFGISMLLSTLLFIHTYTKQLRGN